jgi:hypothetical protein
MLRSMAGICPISPCKESAKAMKFCLQIFAFIDKIVNPGDFFKLRKKGNLLP